MKHTLRSVVVVALITTFVPSMAAAQAGDAADGWKQMAATLKAGSELRLQLNNGQRFTAVLVRADDAGILMQPKTRVPVPPQTVQYADIAALEPRKPGQMSVGKSIGIGIAGGAAGFLAILLITLATVD